MFFLNFLIFILHNFQTLNSFLLECQNTFLYKWSNFLSSKLPSFLDWSNSLCLQLLNTILNKCRLGMSLEHSLLHQWFLCFDFQISYQNKNEFRLHHYFVESNSFFFQWLHCLLLQFIDTQNNKCSLLLIFLLLYF